VFEEKRKDLIITFTNRMNEKKICQNQKFHTQKRPYPMQVEAGKEYHVCMCGKSQNQPLCDGSHAGSGLGPRIFKATETGFIAFCGCKHSKDETGKCDGTHGSL
jgi:CDGSH-type Zn-finger protein